MNMTTARITLTLFLLLGLVPNWSMAVESTIRQAPRLLKGSANGVGELVADTKFTDLNGQAHTISELASAHRMTVIAMTSTSCPLSKKYLPTLVELSKEHADDVAWVIVNPVKTDNDAAMQSAANQLGDHVLYVHDPAEEFAKHVGALTTTDVIVLDRSRTIVYHGAIDDQYGFGYSIEAPRHRYLADALTAIKAGRTPLAVATEAPGCTLRRRTESALDNNITYHNRVSRIIQQNCGNCHREGGVAPFALTTLEDVQSHAGMIEQVVEQGLMPPWFASDALVDKTLVESATDKNVEVLSPWINDCSLGENEKRDLLTWLAGEMPAGDAADAPQSLSFESDWEIGTPDAVFQFAQPQEIKATGVMPYQNVEVPTGLDDDKWVQAIEVKPGNRSVVHHVLVFVQGEGKEHRERDGFWGIYVPGNSSLFYPDGFAKRLPKGAKLHFQMHYTPNGTATTDRTSIGIVYAKQPPQHEVQVTGIFNSKIRIPAGAENHSEIATLPIPADARVLGFLPHMHLRGKAARYELVRSGGDIETLLDVPNYDFNWQLLYRYRDPLLVERGDTIRFTSWYDNSVNNPANPDPTKTVGWGSQTYDEMQVGYVEFYMPNEVPGEVAREVSGVNSQPGNRQAKLFRRLDVNRDGVITRAEVRQRMPGDQKASGPIFDRLDSNSDDELTPAEVEKL